MLYVTAILKITSNRCPRSPLRDYAGNWVKFRVAKHHGAVRDLNTSVFGLWRMRTSASIVQRMSPICMIMRNRDRTLVWFKTKALILESSFLPSNNPLYVPLSFSLWIWCDAVRAVIFYAGWSSKGKVRRLFSPLLLL